MVIAEKYNIKLSDYFTCVIPSTAGHEENEFGNITKINLEGGKELKLFSPIIFKPKSMEIIPRYFKLTRPNTYEAYYDKPNISTLFIRPLILPEDLTAIVSGRTLNFYTKFGDEYSDDFIYAVIKYIPDEKQAEFESKLLKYPFTEETVDLTPHLMAVKYRIPEDLKPDVELLKQGKYSKISYFAKMKIRKYYEYVGIIKEDDYENTMCQILYQGVTLKNHLEKKLDVTLPPGAELHDIYDLEKETFFPDKMLPKIPVIHSKGLS